MIIAVVIYTGFFTKTEPPSVPVKADDNAPNTVALSETQLNAIKIEPVTTRNFSVEKNVFGSVAYHEQDTDNAQSHTLPWTPDKVSAADSTGNHTTKLIVANIPESDSPLIHAGQPVAVKVVAYPDHVFDGKVFALGRTIYDSGGNPAIDPTTHRITVHCKVADPKNELYPGMLADIVIQVQAPVESVAIPMNGVVRKGDGTLTAWVTTDRQHFEERTIIVGLQQDGYDQILEGLKAEELVATDGAVFLNNMLYAPPSD